MEPYGSVCLVRAVFAGVWRSSEPIALGLFDESSETVVGGKRPRLARREFWPATGDGDFPPGGSAATWLDRTALSRSTARVVGTAWRMAFDLEHSVGHDFRAVVVLAAIGGVGEPQMESGRAGGVGGQHAYGRAGWKKLKNRVVQDSNLEGHSPFVHALRVHCRPGRRTGHSTGSHFGEHEPRRRSPARPLGEESGSTNGGQLHSPNRRKRRGGHMAPRRLGEYNPRQKLRSFIHRRALS